MNPKVKRLAAWDRHWILEVDDTVYVDAEIGHRITPTFGGDFLPQSYDEVVHYQCCEPALYNPRATKSGVSFWGRRGRRWYFVLIDASSG